MRERERASERRVAPSKNGCNGSDSTDCREIDRERERERERVSEEEAEEEEWLAGCQLWNELSLSAARMLTLCTNLKYLLLLLLASKKSRSA